MGNRGGRIHDATTRTLTKRRWASKHWIICLTDFKQRQRVLMSPTSYTELFFLDEVTALAAGHRPCFECQRQRAKAFANAFAKSNGVSHSKAGEIDTVLHRERRASGGRPEVIRTEDVSSLPDGAMVASDDVCFAVRQERLLRWSHSGYSNDVPADHTARFVLLTPPSTVQVLREGYSPLFHPTAGP